MIAYRAYITGDARSTFFFWKNNAITFPMGDIVKDNLEEGWGRGERGALDIL